MVVTALRINYPSKKIDEPQFFGFPRANLLGEKKTSYWSVTYGDSSLQSLTLHWAYLPVRGFFHHGRVCRTFSRQRCSRASEQKMLKKSSSLSTELVWFYLGLILPQKAFNSKSLLTTIPSKVIKLPLLGVSSLGGTFSSFTGIRKGVFAPRLLSVNPQWSTLREKMKDCFVIGNYKEFVIL